MLNAQFLWGASTSAFQCEGAILEDGKGLATVDVRKVPNGIADTSIAADHYHHWKEDIDLLKELGVNCYRFSFSWSRIMPDGETVNEKGLQFYENIIDACLENGIEPLPTLYHFEMPQALVDKYGGWMDERTIDAYEKYAITCFTRFKGKVKKWVTINEQLIASSASDLHGIHFDDPIRQQKAIYQISANMSIAEKKAMLALRNIDAKAQVGPVCSIQIVYPHSSAPLDVKAAYDAEEMMMFSLLDMSVFGSYPPTYQHYLKTKDMLPQLSKENEAILSSVKPDFIGINYYFPLCVKAGTQKDRSKLPPFWRCDLFDVVENENLQTSEWMPNGVDPEGLYAGIRKIYDRYHLPMIITENGLALSESIAKDGHVHDEERIEYMQAHIAKVEQARQEGYPVFGYCPWSLMDLVSSHQGFKKRYGLIYIDRTETDPKDCRRIPKDSFYWYQKKIKG